MADISVIITAHKEGVIAGLTARSALNAIEEAKAEGVTSEIIVILDKSDEVTREVLSEALGDFANIIESELGDPGASRNLGVSHATGDFATFLDADDLWSRNWLLSSYKFSVGRPSCVCHSACNIVFGDERNIWWHIDSDSDLFDPDYMRWANYWDAMSFSSRLVYAEIPFRENRLSDGFGHEDWHWNVKTLHAGYHHKPVPDTIHFKRRRAGSQMAQVAKSDAMIWPD